MSLNQDPIHLGIDASNARAGGGVTYLIELLRAARPERHSINQVTIWAGSDTLDRIENRQWLHKTYVSLLDRSLPYRLFWQIGNRDKAAQTSCCNLLFVPGGSYSGSFRPYATMSQNLLPFDWNELKRYGLSTNTARYLLLRWSQSRTFLNAGGTIFLTEFARDAVMAELGGFNKNSVVVPHGVNERFFCPPRPQSSIETYSTHRPLRILYVSIVNLYKHQWIVAEAVAQLREAGYPVELELAGPAYLPALTRLKQTIEHLDPTGTFLRYTGKVPHSEIAQKYHNADLFVFASSCETFGQIITEAMAAGLPIACSNRSSMSETLADAGVYFDPEDSEDIAHALKTLIDSPALRQEKAQLAYQRAHDFTWQRCADETFAFLSKVAQQTA